MTTTLFTASLQHVMMNLIVTLQFQHWSAKLAVTGVMNR
jgi:hypothetical protein